MSNRLPSTRTTQALSPAELSQAEARIEVFHGRLAAHPAHPTRYCVPRERAVSTGALVTLYPRNVVDLDAHTVVLERNGVRQTYRGMPNPAESVPLWRFNPSA